VLNRHHLPHPIPLHICARPLGGNLAVMHADTTRMRTTPKGLKPFVMTNLKTLTGLDTVVAFIEENGMLTA